MTTLSASPVAINDGGSGSVFVVGGDSALGDSSDSTYVQVTNLDATVPYPYVTFPAFAVPDDVHGDIFMSARYEQVSGATEGKPRLMSSVYTAAEMFMNTFAVAGGGVVDEVGGGSAGGVFGSFLNGATNTFELSFDHDAWGACDFRLYELKMHFSYSSGGTVGGSVSGLWKINANPDGDPPRWVDF